MGDVADLFLKPETVSNNQLVIAVPRETLPIKGLKDLGNEETEGRGRTSSSAPSGQSRETFSKPAYAQVRKNVKVDPQPATCSSTSS